ncbi:hypothetical protein AB0K12_00230 [Nonomuraea sp. NPDC049419]|uniref:hypothetical protein n=1 Tax=Nonomuraea sp. NPDC049419 TaxID=3155772 RepID=UPI00342FECF0
MSDFSEFREQGRAALLAGEATHDVPMVEGGTRWGAAVVLRPAGEVVGRLTDLAATVHAPGHWVHGGPALHVTLRSLEPYRSVIPEDDPLRRAYAAALAEAADGLPPAWVYLAGVAPHRGGVLVGAHPVDETLETLRKRFARGLESRGVRDLEYGRVRDRWYVSLVHFAGPLTDAEEIVAWCDAHADTDFGLAELPVAELVQFVHTGAAIRVDELDRVPLSSSPAR